MNSLARDHIDVLRRLFEFKIKPSPTTSSHLRRTCTGGARRRLNPVRRRCCRTAAAHALGLHTHVLNVRQDFAARAALGMPQGRQCGTCAGRGWVGKSRPRRGMQIEGQIKGAARCAPEIQSARGLGAAPRGSSRVPWGHRTPKGCSVGRAPFATADARRRSAFRHGKA